EERHPFLKNRTDAQDRCGPYHKHLVFWENWFDTIILGHYPVPPSVIANPKGEAIQKGKAFALDCFARSNSGSLAMTGGPFAMTAGVVIAK
ncbi:MAG: hypothetical protein LBT00_10300, partial [Spirochaetaceae bacterium]|nr:hypothetical protein [Spirochaetaceae bacterium]